MHQSSAQALQACEDWFDIARSDAAVARQISGILTHCCRTREAYDRERYFMIRQGIPRFLPPRPRARPFRLLPQRPLGDR